MKLLTDELRRDLPALGKTAHQEDPQVLVKFFTPDSSWTWYGIDGSAELQDGHEIALSQLTDEVWEILRDRGVVPPETISPVPLVTDVIFFGYNVGFEAELGNFSFAELSKIKGRMGLPIERDLFFDPCPLSEVQRDHGH